MNSVSKTIYVPTSNYIDDWVEFIADNFDYAESKSKIDNLIVHFSTVSFLETDDIVVLACLIEFFHYKGANISFKGGTEKFNKHLINIKFKSYWNKGFDRGNFTVSKNRTTLCLWKISKNMISCYSSHAKEYFKSTFFNDKDLVPLASNLDEVFNNIYDHSKSIIEGYIITQYFPSLHKLSFSVCDFGIGIPSSVNEFNKSNNIPLLNDSQALLKSLEQGFTIKSTPQNRGFGLNNILELTESSNGELRMQSNRGVIIKKAGIDPEKYELSNNFHGTLVRVDIDTNTFEFMEEDLQLFDF